MKKIQIMLLATLVVVALSACSCSMGMSTSPTPKPSAMTTTPMPTPSATATPSASAMPSPDASMTPGASDAGGADTAMDTEALAAEVEKLSEVDTCDVVVMDNQAIVGISFDAQYQGTLTDRIEEMVAEKITAKEAGITKVAVTADPTLCTEIKTLSAETNGKAMTEEQKTKFDELYAKITPAGTESSAAA